ncbi:hypothetical protein BB560_002576 [Smittium megazygosporum]|uniref:Uncharacterized protein n=1 Tax=Smittium megazygosporum TaxID=133381 RepID=A0A2T9ZED3_9FUNG|nr:hypothetical protein BB560_002576 [Smittium megazygosporum]
MSFSHSYELIPLEPSRLEEGTDQYLYDTSGLWRRAADMDIGGTDQSSEMSIAMEKLKLKSNSESELNPDAMEQLANVITELNQKVSQLMIDQQQTKLAIQQIMSERQTNEIETQEAHIVARAAPTDLIFSPGLLE